MRSWLKIPFVLHEKGEKMMRCLPLKDAAGRLLLRSTKHFAGVLESELLKLKDWTGLEVDEAGLCGWRKQTAGRTSKVSKRERSLQVPGPRVSGLRVEK